MKWNKIETILLRSKVFEEFDIIMLQLTNCQELILIRQFDTFFRTCASDHDEKIEHLHLRVGYTQLNNKLIRR